MEIETVLGYVMRQSQATKEPNCLHEKSLFLRRRRKRYRVLAVINKKMTARVYSGRDHVGTWSICADKNPILICQKDGKVYVFDQNGRAYPHPHVGGETGTLCWGNVTPRIELPFIMSALLNVNLSSAYWRPRYTPLREGQ